jgi:phage recombination protein Bet
MGELKEVIMVTADVEEKKPSVDEKSVTYVPMGTRESMTLTVAYVKNFLATPTRSGRMPTNGDIVKFMMLCKARGLDPWQGDAYLTGYDNEDGSATFNLITAVQALLKRAELCDEFDGIESGIVVMQDGKIEERQGTITMEGEVLLGGWARCYRSDRKAAFYQSVPLSVYDTKRSRWKKDPTGMIQKVAKAHVLREAFPNHLAGLKTFDEMDRVVDGEVSKPTGVAVVKTAADLTAALKARAGQSIEVAPAKIYLPDSAPSIVQQLTQEIQVATKEKMEGLEAEIALGKFGAEDTSALRKLFAERWAELSLESTKE